MKHIYIFILLAFCLSVYSQRGKDGVPNITLANTIVNAYTPLTINASSGTRTLTVANSAAFSVGDLIYIIQMQGASVNVYHGGNTGPWYDSNSALPTDTSFGRIIAYNNCGVNEFAQVNAVPNSTTIVIDCNLKNDYDVNRIVSTSTGTLSLKGQVQVVRVPRYVSLTLNGSASISCQQWNGSTGGVAIIEVDGNTILNSTNAINVTAKGFRGGVAATQNQPLVTGGDKFGSNLNSEGGYKGESIAGDTTFYRNYAAIYSRGAVANGGGGGSTHNAGGGGGANGNNGVLYNGLGNPNIFVSSYTTIWNRESVNFALNTSSGGGKGGYSFSGNNQNLNTTSPGTYSTSSNGWGGDLRRAVGGFGGRSLNYTNGRLFLGGGAGAGHGNDSRAGSGGNGGGLAYLICYGNLTGSGNIVADGGNGFNSALGCSANDGAGGGGGGGTIVLNVYGTQSLTASPALSANGGNGGNVNFNCILLNSTGYGPGGGGGGGYIASSITLPVSSVNGGLNGIQTGNSSNISTSFPPNGATKGGSGETVIINNQILTTSLNPTVCINESFTLTAVSSQTDAAINWYNTLVGSDPIATGNQYVSLGYSSAGTYTLFVGTCSGTYRKPIIITVGLLGSLSVDSPTICTGQTATLQANGATSYTWNPGNIIGNTYTISPSATTTVSVLGTNGNCFGQVISTITVNSSAPITVSNSTICVGQTAILTASGANTYTWNTGVNTNTLAVTPVTTQEFTVTGSIGSCSGIGTGTVVVNTLPNISVNSLAICTGQQATLTAQGADTYTWSSGTNGSVQAVTPALSVTYTVTGTNLLTGCTNTAISVVNVNNTPTVTINTSSVCSGNTAALTALGAVSYTWSTLETTQTINPTPIVTTTYSVIGAIGGCSATAIATVNVFSPLSLTVNSSNTIGCANLCVDFTNVLDPSATGIIYNFGDGQVGNLNNPTHCYTTSGNYTVVATAINSVVGCSYSYTLPTIINVFTTPIVDFDIQKGASVNSEILLNLTNTSSNALNYTWTLCDGSISSATNITTSYNESNACCIELVAANATCTNSVTHCLDPQLSSQISIPNVFTPNNDKKNDVFKVIGVGIKSFSCSIYDRWGLKIYDWNDINAGWDGSALGGLAPAGTYFYIINYIDSKNKSVTEKGFLSLFRD